MSEREDLERLREERPDAYLRRREFLAQAAAIAGLAGLETLLPVDTLLSAAARSQARRGGALPSPRNMPIDTFCVLMMENRSYDHYFGWYEKGDGRNHLRYPDGHGGFGKTHRLAPDFQGCGFEDPDHSWHGGRVQYDRGRLDGFLIASDAYALGYYLEQDIPFIPHAAKAFTLYDRYFASLLGPTWPNRLYMHSAQCGGRKSNDGVADALNQGLLGDGLYRWETIWDRCLQAGVSCAYYVSDQPFIGVFGKRFVPIVRPASQFAADAAAGRLPHVSFVDPPFLDGGGGHGLSGDEHPHGDIRIGQAFMSEIVHAFMSSPQFRRGALFINYDEWGGFFDHVAPVLVPDDRSSRKLSDNFGITGFRIPGVVVSPYARAGEVSHMTVTHESILKLISYRFDLGYLTKRHRYASNIGHSLDWKHPRFEPPDLPRVLPPVGVLPCDLQRSRGGAEAEARATREAREREGIEIGDPRMIEYFHALGYPAGPADPERIFSDPEAVRRVRSLWRGLP